MRPVYLTLSMLQLASLIACGSALDGNLENRACTSKGECLRGYVCSPQQVCVKRSETIDEPQTEVDSGPSAPDAAPDADGVSTGTGATPAVVCDRGVMCGANCVDVNQNTEHCGACNRRCASTDHGQAICNAGSCAVACDDGYTRCGDRCYHLSSDESHCGSCTFSCPSESNSAVSCVDGRCQTTCNPGSQDCGGECVRLETDARHCGACGKACAGDQQCAAAMCVKECPGGTIECERSCVDSKADVLHCGACGRSCSAPANASPVCRDGTCAFQCKPGLMPCGDACVDTQTDLANCGACGQACPDTSSFSHPVCETGKCNTRCNSGFFACENQCVSLALIANNRSLQACALLAGLQDFMSCSNMGANSTYCSNQCVDTGHDERHCGGCGKACEAGQTCEGGSCK